MTFPGEISSFSFSVQIECLSYCRVVGLSIRVSTCMSMWQSLRIEGGSDLSFLAAVDLSHLCTPYAYVYVGVGVSLCFA